MRRRAGHGWCARGFTHGTGNRSYRKECTRLSVRTGTLLRTGKNAPGGQKLLPAPSSSSSGDHQRAACAAAQAHELHRHVDHNLCLKQKETNSNSCAGHDTRFLVPRHRHTNSLRTHELLEDANSLYAVISRVPRPPRTSPSGVCRDDDSVCRGTRQTP